MAINPFTERPIIAITGSAGKTTTKTMVAAVLRTKWIIFESKDYWNTTEHTHKHAEQLDHIHHAAVLEYGMAYPGVITKHCEILQPNISIVTNVAVAHVGNFDGKVEGVAEAKSELIKGMKQTGVLYVNQDDANSKLLHTQHFQGQVITVGIEQQADYMAHAVGYASTGMSFQVKLGGQDHAFTIPMFGEHNVYNALFAIAVADQLGFTPQEIKQGLQAFKKPNRRLDIFSLRDGITVIDDTVHAHPTAMKAALDVLVAIGKQKKIVVFGRMPELGPISEEAHKDIGKYLADQPVDLFYTYGNTAHFFGEGALAAGFPADNIKHFANNTREKLHAELVVQIEPGTTILVKGASRLNMQETVLFLRDTFQEK